MMFWILFLCAHSYAGVGNVQAHDLSDLPNISLGGSKAVLASRDTHSLAVDARAHIHRKRSHHMHSLVARQMPHMHEDGFYHSVLELGKTRETLRSFAAQEAAAHMEKTKVLRTCLWIGAICLAGCILHFAVNKAILKFDFVEPALIGMLFCFASASLQMINKACVDITQAPATLALIQMVVSVVITMLFCFHEVVSYGVAKLRYWLVQALLWAACMCTTMLTYERSTISLMVVISNIAPLLTLLLEDLAIPAEQRPALNTNTLACLMFMFIGTLLYSWDFINSAFLSVFVVLSNVLLYVVDRVVRRRLFVKECSGIPLSVAMVANNAMAIIPTGILIVIFREHETYKERAGIWLDFGTLFLVCASSLMAASLAYFSLACQQAMSATSCHVLMNTTKVMVLCIGSGIFGDKITGLDQAFGIALSLSASLGYSLVEEGTATYSKRFQFSTRDVSEARV